MSTFDSATISSIRTFAHSGSTVGCHILSGHVVAGGLEKSLPYFAARSMNSPHTPRVTRSHFPDSFLRHVASITRTIPFVKSPPSEP